MFSIDRSRRTAKLRNNAHQPTYATWARGAREVPDMLVAAELSLRPLARGEATPSSAETQRIVGDACNLLRDALANLVEVTRNLPDFPLERAGANVFEAQNVVGARDPRMSPPSDYEADLPRSVEQCALTRPFSRPDRNIPGARARLTDIQLDRLRRCANGNTLRFEAADIVAALVDAGYATEGVGRVVTVTPEGHRYLSSQPAA